VTFRWLDGGCFLLQDVELEQNGQRITGIEVIGRGRGSFAGAPSEDVKSRSYSNTGDTFARWGR
jgi:hypothetical protein